MQWVRQCAMGLALALTLAACGPSEQGDKASSAAPAGNELPAASDADRDAEILAWARRAHSTNLIEPVTTFYGDFTGDGADDALVFAYFAMGGSGAGLNVALFKNEDGHMAHFRDVDDVFGMEPRDAHFETGKITVSTLMPGPNDPHCCPTQRTPWEIDAN